MKEEQPATRQTLAAQLRELGIAPGDVVLFHSSMKKIGPVEPRAEAVIEAFLDVLGPQGTLVAPALVPAMRGIRPLYDHDNSPSEMGLLTEIVRKWPGAIRSHHSTHSVAAIGRLAEEITAAHPRGHGPLSPWGRSALGFDTPWDRLRELNAWVLLIGVGFTRCTLLHHVQARYAAAHQGLTVETPWPELPMARLGERLLEKGIARRFRFGGADCLAARAGDIVSVALALLENEPDTFFPPGSPVGQWRQVCTDIQTLGRPRAATFRADITLPSPNRPRKVVRPIMARGLMIDHPQGGRAILVTTDHGAFLNREAALIRKAISDTSHTPYEAVTVAATHNHSSCRYHWHADHAEFVNHVARVVASAAEEAVTRLEPVRAGWTGIDAPGIRLSRNVYLRDGRAYTERWAIPSSWNVGQADIAHRGPDDDELRILVIERLDRTRLAVVGNFSCHNSAGLQADCVQDDFFGFAMETVEDALDEDTTVLMTPGSEGDQDPTAIIRLGGDRDMAYVRKLGLRLAGYLQVALAQAPMHDLFAVGTGQKKATLTVRDDWKPVGEKSPNPEFQEYARMGKIPCEVTALAVGDYAMVGIPAEIFTQPARMIREHAPYRYTSVLAVTNGDVQYVPEQEAFFEGSMIYGVEPNGAAVVAAGSDRLLSQAGIEALRQAHRVQESQRRKQ